MDIVLIILFNVIPWVASLHFPLQVWPVVFVGGEKDSWKKLRRGGGKLGHWNKIVCFINLLLLYSCYSEHAWGVHRQPIMVLLQISYFKYTSWMIYYSPRPQNIIINNNWPNLKSTGFSLAFPWHSHIHTYWPTSIPDGISSVDSWARCPFWW